MVNLLITHIKGCIATDAESVKFEHSEIATMVKLRNRFPKSREMQDWTRYFITLHQAEVDDLTEMLMDGKREIKKLCGI